MSWRVINGDALTVLRTLPGESVQCCVTSPPYWGLRDYGHNDQIGQESTPAEYVARLVEVFREVRRVLRSDATLWLNLGDCYATGAGRVGDCPGGGEQGARWRGDVDRVRDDKRGLRFDRLANGRGDQPAVQRRKTRASRDGTHAGKHTGISAMGPMTQPNRMPIEGLKPKDMVGIPWRVAFALQANGWWLRSDIVWGKPNCMPESVLDRPTKAHEYVFLLSKSERYYYDAAAIAEEGVYPAGHVVTGSLKRNKRSVWHIPTQPFPGAHFAVMPMALAEPCVLAGCPRGGAVLDPFAGAGTVGVVALRHGRSFTGIELNPAYCDLARERIRNDAPLLNAASEERAA